MLDVNNTLRSFWQEFGTPVFFENFASEPFPLITYQFALADFATEYSVSARLWTRDASHPKISQGFSAEYWTILNAIEKAIPPEVGTTREIENGGNIWLMRGTPFIVHNVPDEQKTIKSALINLDIKIYKI